MKGKEDAGRDGKLLKKNAQLPHRPMKAKCGSYSIQVQPSGSSPRLGMIAALLGSNRQFGLAGSNVPLSSQSGMLFKVLRNSDLWNLDSISFKNGEIWNHDAMHPSAITRCLPRLELFS